MVWSDVDGDGNAVVLAANRSSTKDWFGEPTAILHANVRAPQLLGHHCKQLYAGEDGQLARRDR